jgi:nucleotide-binding universal stress UspA family protein
MFKILLSVDGSANSDRALDHVLGLSAAGTQLEIHLLNVQIPIASGHVTLFVSQSQINQYLRDEGLKALQPARDRLDISGVHYSYHIGVGHVAETIAEYARERRCDNIVMGTRGLSGWSNLLLGSVATKVLKLSAAPVTLVK